MTTDNIFRLPNAGPIEPTTPPPPNPELINLLRQVLAAAEAGHVQSVAVGTINANGSIGIGLCLTPGHNFALVGVLETIKLQALTANHPAPGGPAA